MAHPITRSNQRLPCSVTIIALNEERRLPRTLDALRWADEIILVDSGSTDRTREIAAAAGARVIEQPWLGYGQQKNFAQDLATYDWVLNVDADEIVVPALQAEIEEALIAAASESSDPPLAYAFPRKTFFWGRWIRYGGWYPNYVVRLVDRRSARWSEPAVHEQLESSGEVRYFCTPAEHHSFDGIRDQVVTNLRFSWEGSQELKRRAKRASVAHLLLKPYGKFLETYFWKRGFMDGLPGLVIAINAAYSMFLKYAYVIEEKETSRANPDHR